MVNGENTTSVFVSGSVGNGNNGNEKQIEDADSSVDGAIPLRLLVIGDSLAIGVGQSKHSTPVLKHRICLHRIRGGYVAGEWLQRYM